MEYVVVIYQIDPCEMYPSEALRCCTHVYGPFTDENAAVEWRNSMPTWAGAHIMMLERP